MKTVVIITGFGKFNGVEDNPTTHLVNELVRTGFSLPNCECRFNIFEVSVDCCKSYLSALDFSENRFIFIHIGVDSNADQIKLEQFAYNNMSFRVPDEKGYQPDCLQITCDKSLDEKLETSFCLDIVCDALNFAGYDGSVMLSDNPGRFLCNYIYYNTLQLLHKQDKPLHSVFIHVPSFDVINKENQVAFVKKAITLLVAQAS